jgi:hypothetical protein
MSGFIVPISINREQYQELHRHIMEQLKEWGAIGERDSRMNIRVVITLHDKDGDVTGAEIQLKLPENRWVNDPRGDTSYPVRMPPFHEEEIGEDEEFKEISVPKATTPSPAPEDQPSD